MISRVLLHSSIIFLLISCVSASDSWDDFANNLATDLVCFTGTCCAHRLVLDLTFLVGSPYHVVWGTDHQTIPFGIYLDSG